MKVFREHQAVTQTFKDDHVLLVFRDGFTRPEGDVEVQELDWCQVREGQVSGETHYKAILDAAWVRERSYQEGRLAGLAEATIKLGWEELATVPGIHRSMDHCR